MEKTLNTPKGDQEPHDAPAAEPNGLERNSEESEKGHSHEPERVVEWGGPNGRYGKVTINKQAEFVVECNTRKGSVQGCLESH
jgi:hypothetical protein